jgi:deferrochelatase/peroxidase EfeB
MAGGTYQVFRRILMLLDIWDASSLAQQQDTFGRYKLTGAPYGGKAEFDRVNIDALPANCHVRLANPRIDAANEQERILRRSYSFHDGYNTELGRYEAGLAFFAYQRDPRRQFVRIQRRLAASDALNRYAVHTASGLFAVPPGVQRGGYVGETLFSA